MQTGSVVLTPVEEHRGILVKRDDLFEFAGVRGGKVRTCLALARRAVSKGQEGLVTASARTSPQSVIVARVGAQLGLKTRVHVPQGEYSLMMEMAEAAGAEIVQHKAGYNTVINARSIDDAKTTGWRLVPFGMQCWEAVTQTKEQVANIPPDTKRIVVTIGSGMSAVGILRGLRNYQLPAKMVGVVVGASPIDRLDCFAPMGWRSRIKLRKAAVDYSDPAPVTEFDGIELDPYYEAKCLPFLEPGDLFWNVGIRPFQ